jgi:hypothetical protein
MATPLREIDQIGEKRIRGNVSRFGLNHPRSVPHVSVTLAFLVLSTEAEHTRVSGKANREREELRRGKLKGIPPTEVINRAEVRHHISLVVNDPCNLSESRG